MTTQPVPKVATGDSPAGLAFAISAYVLWGFLPLYLRLLDQVPPLELVGHRVIWSVPVAGLVLIALGRTGDLREALRSPRTVAQAALTAGLVTINWLVYVWAVANDRTVDASLGYYINPLFSVFLGAVVLGERPGRLQAVAIALAALAVAVLTFSAGGVPWVSLVLPVSWGFYALLKKSLPIGANQGFLLEVLILSVVALPYVMWLELRGAGQFAGNVWLLMGCGLVTAVPLMLFANGAKRLRLTTIAILQYIAPTLILLCAVIAFGEPVTPAQRVAFPLIWAALAVYTISLWRARR